jgi:hypothetical protein
MKRQKMARRREPVLAVSPGKKAIGAYLNYNSTVKKNFLNAVSNSSYFLGDPPPDPRFLASLGELSLAELDQCSPRQGAC